MPEDKINWSVEDQGRTVIDQLQECARAPLWYIYIGENLQTPDKIDREIYKKLTEESKAWSTIDECEAKCKENTAKLFEWIKSVPDAEIEKSYKLPVSDQPLSVAQLMQAHHVHLVYHTGQINFIQTLYGDKEAH